MSEIYNSLKQPPKWALKGIQAGRLKGKSDINPQWRIEKMDEVFGLCGQGWTYEIIDLFTLPGGNNEVAAFAKINLYTCKDGEWSRPIPGIGGSMLVEQEKKRTSHKRRVFQNGCYRCFIRCYEIFGNGGRCL